MAVLSREYGSNENASGDGALRNGPLFGNSLSAALEMGDAYRSFQLETFCEESHIQATGIKTATYGLPPVIY